MTDTLRHVVLHADSGRPRTVEAPTMTLDASCLPGHIVITLFEPTRMVVIERAKLVEALQSI